MTLIWLYCVTTKPAAQLTGIDGAPVRPIEGSGLVALVSDVSTDYEQPALDERVRDADWLTPRATAHQEVNAAVHRANDAALPVPFATIYRSDDRVREMLRERSGELSGKLASVRGRSEWVVALYRDLVVTAEQLAREPVAAVAGEGRRYLEERKREGERRAELRRLDETAAAAARDALAAASDRRFDEPVADDAHDVIARATYLVRDAEALGRAIAEFDRDWVRRGYELRATGPWPPYRSAA